LWPEAPWLLLGRLGPIWVLFLDFPLGCVGSPEVVVFCSFLHFFILFLFFQFVPRNKKTMSSLVENKNLAPRDLPHVLEDGGQNSVWIEALPDN
jgi:hypothetical protein